MPTDPDRERRRRALLTALAEVRARKAADPDSWSPQAQALLGDAGLPLPSEPDR